MSLLGLSLLAQTPLPPPLPESDTAPPVPESTAPPPVTPDGPAVFKIAGFVICTLRGPSAIERVERAQARFADVVRTATQPRFTVELSGNNGGAILYVNGKGLLDITPTDAAANGTSRVLPIAQIWAGRLRSVLASPSVIKQLFVFSGLPERFNFAGADYQRGTGTVSDFGRFATDGTRASGPDGRERIVFWDAQLPPPYTTVYLLNRFREFIPYNRQ